MSIAPDLTVSDTTEIRPDESLLRHLVHKRALENVLVTGIGAQGHDRFTCTGRIPSSHSFFNQPGRSPRKDILFYTELGRQASLAVSHKFLGVSAADVFIFEGSEATLTDAARRPVAASDCVVMDIDVQEITRRKNGAVNRVVAEHSMSVDGELVFRGTGAWSVQPAALFQRLRRTSSTGPMQGGIAAPCASVNNVVIARPTHGDDPTSFASSLIVDYSHPYFFDHACDHIPGMLLLEGCAQLALLAFAQTTSVLPGRAAICAYEVNFSRFVECGAFTTLVARVNAEDDVEIVISQPDGVCGTTTMRVAFPA